MNKITTAAMCVVGGMLAGGMTLYFLMPRDSKKEIKDLMSKMTMKDNGFCSCDCCK